MYADMHNNFVFLEQDRTKSVPIGGLTKLMTALVATEYINIEKTTTVTEDVLVDTEIKRLKAEDGDRYVSTPFSRYCVNLLMRQGKQSRAFVW